MATYSMRRNFIATLTQVDGTIISYHDQKAGLLWLSYKDRLGVSGFSDILLELSELIQYAELPCWHEPFTMDEILAVLKDMPLDFAPSPDGFNGAFFKMC
jgi:hypothetical protein